MVARVHSVWVRAAALGVLAAWLPCMPLGLCARAVAADPASHHCCRRPAVKMAAAPQECWVQSTTPTPTGPPSPALAAPAVVVAQARPAPDTAAADQPRPIAFSPLAIVLRI
jgi:hypothetical protein